MKITYIFSLDTFYTHVGSYSLSEKRELIRRISRLKLYNFDQSVSFRGRLH